MQALQVEVAIRRLDRLRKGEATKAKEGEKGKYWTQKERTSRVRLGVKWDDIRSISAVKIYLGTTI